MFVWDGKGGGMTSDNYHVNFTYHNFIRTWFD